MNFVTNSQDLNVPVNSYSLNTNPAKKNTPIAFSIYSDIIGDQLIEDGSFVDFESTNLGLIGGAEDPSVSIYGVNGDFLYCDNILTGMKNDTPDKFMNATDGLADIQEYIINANKFNWQMRWQKPTVHHNVYCGFFLTYSTPCAPINAVVSKDTAVCAGVDLVLNASGGMRYEWLPKHFLSCYDCPNPTFNGDSTTNYSVRIWGNDSCSVVRPVRVEVLPKPYLKELTSSATSCGDRLGKIVFSAQTSALKPLSFSIDSSAFFTAYQADSLAFGSHTLRIVDKRGCPNDTTFSIEKINLTKAGFMASPASGVAPLNVTLFSNAQHATNWSFWLNDTLLKGQQPSFTLDVTGSYKIEQIAWNKDSLCADTASIFVVVRDSLQLVFPNVFTPNKDGLNDIFGIRSNFPIHVIYSIVNRWGQTLAQGETSQATPTNNGFFYALWDGAAAVDGVYFYQLEIISTTLVPPTEIKHQGFVEVFGSE